MGAGERQDHRARGKGGVRSAPILFLDHRSIIRIAAAPQKKP
jgi:hypothetical protein